MSNHNHVSSGAAAPLPWSEDISSKEMLKNSNDIYRVFVERYIQAAGPNFSVPEFEATNRKIESYWQQILQSLGETVPPQKRWRLQHVAHDMDKYLRETTQQTADKKRLEKRRREFETTFGLTKTAVDDFNASLSESCMLERFKLWKQVAYDGGELKYFNFWKGFYFFAKSISLPCIPSTRVDLMAEPIPESMLNNSCVESGFCLPVFLKDSSFADFNAIIHVPLNLIGMIDKIMIVDYQARRPVDFVVHDLSHAAAVNGRLSREHSDMFVSMDSQGIFRSEPAKITSSQVDEIMMKLSVKKWHNECVIQGIENSQAAKILEMLYFFYSHETPAPLDKIETEPPPAELPKLDQVRRDLGASGI